MNILEDLPPDVVFMAFVVALCVVIGLVSLPFFLRERRRRKEIRRWAAQNGWKYRKSDVEMARVVKGRSPFDHSWKPTGTDVVSINLAGRHVFAFDFNPTKDAGPVRGVLLVDTHGVVPYLDVVGRRGTEEVLQLGWREKLLALTFRGLDQLPWSFPAVEGWRRGPQSFDRMYLVRRDDPAIAAQILTPEVQDHLFSAGQMLLEPTWRFENGLLVVINRYCWHSGDIDRCTRAALGLLDLIPAEVFQPSGLPPGRFKVSDWNWRRWVISGFDDPSR